MSSDKTPIIKVKLDAISEKYAKTINAASLAKALNQSHYFKKRKK